MAKAATAGHQGPLTPTKTDNTHPHLTSAPANNDSSAVTNKNRRNESAGADVTGTAIQNMSPLFILNEFYLPHIIFLLLISSSENPPQ